MLSPQPSPPNQAAHSPFRGILPFGDSDFDRRMFCGRDEEADRLTAQVVSSPIVVLFSQSGLGKTSLLAAGVLERLRIKGYFPVMVQLNRLADVNGDRRSGGLGEFDIGRGLARETVSSATAQGVALEYNKAFLNLWDFFCSLRCRKNGKVLRPILIIDQFEELFTSFTRPVKDAFIQQFSDLVGNRVPGALRADAERRLADGKEKSKEEEERLVRLAYGDIGHDAKVLIAVRDEALPKLDELKAWVPIIFRTTFRLLPLTPEKAREAIKLPPQRVGEFGGQVFSFDEDAVEEMLGFLKDGKDANGGSHGKDGSDGTEGASIEPLQLQILCEALDAARRRQNKLTVSKVDLGGLKGLRHVITAYYKRAMARIPLIRSGWNGRRAWPSWSNWLLFNLPRSAARYLCERGLITPHGQRNAFAGDYIEERFGLVQQDVDALVDAYLLRGEPRRGLIFYELSYDSLAGTLADLGRERQSKMFAVGALGLAVLVAVVATEGTRRYQTWSETRQKAEERRQICEGNKDLGAVKDFASAEGIRLVRLAMETPCPERRTFPDLSSLTLVSTSANNVDLSKVKSSAPEFRSSVLRGVNLEEASLPKASFASATIGPIDGKLTSMRGADLRDTRFDDATITSANFSNADLSRAAFTRTRLSNVDFSFSDLRNAGFDNADIAKDEKGNYLVDLQGTAWWLAKGWDDPQIKQFTTRFIRDTVTASQAFKREKDKWEAEVKSAGEAGDRRRQAEALNDYAWSLATWGIYYEEAKKKSEEALKILRELKGSGGYDRNVEASFMDTLGLIDLLLRKYPDAKNNLADVIKIAEENKLQSTGEWHYRYALALVQTGDASKAREMREQARSLGYAPTFERTLLNDLVTALNALP